MRVEKRLQALTRLTSCAMALQSGQILLGRMQHETMYTICMNALAIGDLGNCEPLGLSLADWATILALLIVVLGGLKFLAAPIARLFGSRGPRRIRSFRGLRNALRRLAQDNKRIFRTFGPKSRANDDGFDRFDVAAWHRARLNIKENNEKVLALLQDHFDLIPARHQTAFTRWINHIQAFSAHLEDPAVDYRHHQFPSEIDEVLKV